ncbi:hypothetical protein HU200_060584 [Digitaria exilis]|uniref:Peptidase A1 domain-containing protein n=1 Tax=Digitaria exilis TaxID=1010633 RepID=A0A835DXE9_9POAL|nr:hypothetical protein HU200_060584 [Digitaria exilis]
MATNVALVTLVISFLATAPPSYSESHGFRASMSRREPTINFTRASHNSYERLLMLAARHDAATGVSHGVRAQAPLRLDASGAAYDMSFSIGTPPQKLSALADTGSDLIWTKCGACHQCTPYGSPSYYPNKSSSFSKLPCTSNLCVALANEAPTACSGAGGVAGKCDYVYFYGGIGFGCTTMSEGGYGTAGSGLVGLGRGPISLVSQLNAGAFSYCLTTKFSKSSPLLFGAFAGLSGAGVQSMPLLPSSIFYVVNVKKITIGSKTTAGTGTAGVVFDSGTTVTFLAEPAYTAALKAVRRETKLPKTAGIAGFDACFRKKRGGGFGDVGDSWKTAIPSMFGEVEDGMVCWIVQESPSLSIIGNIMQMSFHIRYGVDEEVLSFQPANCDKFPAAPPSLSLSALTGEAHPPSQVRIEPELELEPNHAASVLLGAHAKPPRPRQQCCRNPSRAPPPPNHHSAAPLLTKVSEEHAEPLNPLPLALQCPCELARVAEPSLAIACHHHRSIFVHNPQNGIPVDSSLSWAKRDELWSTLAPFLLDAGKPPPSMTSLSPINMSHPD